MSFNIPGLLEGTGVALSIFLIIFLIRKSWKMYTVLALASVVLVITNGNSINANVNILYHSLTSSTAYFLVTMVITITLLGNLHQKVGAMEKLVCNLRFIIRDPRALLMVFPAVISLFSTVPGGAIISAPMVEETGRELKMSRIELAVSNMVYRHLVVLITPFNSSLILISGITGISIASYLGFTIPVIVMVFLLATIWIYFKYPKIKKADDDNLTRGKRKEAFFELLINASPYIVAISLGLIFNIYFPLALCCGIVITFFLNLPSEGIAAELKKRLLLFIKGFNWPIALSTLSIVIYKDYMIESESFFQAVNSLVEFGFPVMALLIVFPFITGFITGNNTASLGICLPVLIPLLGPDMLSVKYFGLVYLSSYAGYLGSPIHLCTYLTNEYFQTPMYSLIKNVNVYGAIMLLLGFTLSLFY